MASLFPPARPGHTQPFANWTDLAAKNAENGVDIDPDTAATKWRDEQMDYGIAIDALLYRTRRAAGDATRESKPF
jgi:hypothetical protein